MEEKKLTDGELLRLLAIFAKDDEPNGVRLLAEGALDLIHRLQAENERLTEENDFLDGCAKQFFADYQKCEIANAELQKQVDELKGQTWKGIERNKSGRTFSCKRR